jgi:phage-related protein/predicted XRE-type DNA-binding protein
MRPVVFLGDSLGRLRALPQRARRDTGFQLDRVQRGLEPDDWKPMTTIGPGVKEIRVRNASGAFRVTYVASFAEAVYVLHAFQKKTRRTTERDLEIAVSGIEARSLAMRKQFASVWDAIEPSRAEAASMKARAEAMIAIQAAVTRWGVTQAAAAKRLGLTQPRLNDLLRGRINKFSLDALVDLAARAGLSVRIAVARKAA